MANDPAADSLGAWRPGDKLFLSIDEAADLLSISRDFIERRKSEFGAVRIGRVFRIPMAGIKQFLRDNAVQPIDSARRRGLPIASSDLIERARRQVLGFRGSPRRGTRY